MADEQSQADHFADQFKLLERAISSSRLGPYQQEGADEFQTFGLYLWNIELCQNLYPALNILEIALRNSIHNAAAEAFDDEYWFLSRLAGPEKSRVDAAVQSLRNQGPVQSPGEILALLTLGFWVSLFNSRYEKNLWPLLLRPAFPEMPRELRTRQHIFDRLDAIRKLRNRVFHHEPVWNSPALLQRHAEIIRFIGWISPPMLLLAELVDAFGGGYTRGAQHYAAQLRARLPRRRRPPGGTSDG